MKVKSLSHVQLFATPWTVAHQASPSMEFSRQEYWSGLPFPSPGNSPFLETTFPYIYNFSGASLLPQMVKNLPAMWETWVQSLSWDDPLEKGMATHSGILAWETPRTEGPGRLQSMESQSQTQLSN